MSRQNYEYAFVRISQEVLPPHLSILDFNGVKLHPRFVPVEVDKHGVQTGGGWDNSATVFGLTVPNAAGKSLICRVSAKTEKAMAENDDAALKLLRTDLRTAVTLWDAYSVRHEEAIPKTVSL